MEITAKGYGSIDYPSPGRIGEKIFYRFTFLPEKLVFTKNRAFATFLMQGIGTKDGAIIFSAEWKVVYNPTSQIRHAIYYQPIPFVGSGVVWNVTTKEEIIIRLMQILLIATIFFSYWLGTH